MNNIGILDPDGKNLNPLNNNKYSKEYKNLAKKWKTFPAYENAKNLIKNIKDNNVILITSGTGSGKTVLIPKFCLHSFDYNAKIAITLPKQMIAKSAAEFSALTLDVNLGDEIAYEYKGSDKSLINSKNKLIYATDGTIVARLINDPLLKEYNAVIIDEAHERKVQIDFLLYLLKNVLENRNDFKLIIMSATINVDIFKDYFKKFKFIHEDIGGKTNFPIHSIFLDNNIKSNTYIDKGVEIINKILKENEKNCDILFFVTSVLETSKVCEKLSNLDHVICFEVFSGMDKKKQELAQDKDLYKEIYPNKKVKVVISTNVAESSLTIDGIKFVIDSGLELFNYYDPLLKSNVLKNNFITKAQVKQRMGRTGRTESGTCYHLYTEKTYNDMENFPKPNIKISKLNDEILKLLINDSINDVNDLKKIFNKFIEPPDNKYIDSSLDDLIKYKLLSNDKLTDLGIFISKLQMNYNEALTILCSHDLNCINEVLLILSLINSSKNSISNIFILPSNIIGDDPEKKEELSNLTKKFEQNILKFKNKYGDHLSLLKIMKNFIKYLDNPKKLDNFIYKYFLKRNCLDNALNLYKKYLKKYNIEFKKLNKLKTKKEYSNKYNILASFLFGFRFNIAKIDNKLIVTKYVLKNLNLNKMSFLKFEDIKNNYISYFDLTTFNDKSKLNITSIVPKKSIKIFNDISNQYNI